MIPVAGFRGRRVAVFGLGASGVASARALVAGGAEALAWDDDPEACRAAETEGVALADLAKVDFADIAALVLAPGVPLTHPQPHWAVQKARAAGTPVVGDIELFCRERRRSAPEAPLVAVTGTNGKSTTTALIAHLLATAGRDVQVGGNIGTAVLSLAPPRPGRTHVLECSSFQIELAPSLDPTVGILLNLSPDHLDRHGTFARYAGLKERLVAAAATAVIGVDDTHSAAIADRLEQAGRRVVRISVQYPLAHGVGLDGNRLIAVEDGAAETVASLAGLSALRGRHNAQNAAAAVATARALGLSDGMVTSGLATFPGLPHRLEEVGRLGHVVFVNDSKATNADAAGKALASFNRIYWIVGGRPKSDGILGLEQLMPRVAKAYLIGEAAEAFAGTLEGHVAYEMSQTLARATAAAAADAAGDPADEVAVLLSPACASYDQFRNFAERGDCFRRLVQSISGVEARGAAA